jgi:hypothetical protein
MALRWAAVAFDEVSKGFRRIMGYKHLWMLKLPWTSHPEISHLLINPRPANLGFSRSRQANLPLHLGHHQGSRPGPPAGPANKKPRIAAGLRSCGLSV